MIDLGRGRDELLQEIGGAADLLERSAVDGSDPGLGRLPQAHLSLAAHTRDELMPVLRDILARYFSWLPQEQLAHDVLRPLRRALGNAYKRGNVGLSGKWIRVELGLTRRGLLIEVRDQGSGFDVASVLDRYRRNERYFTNHGSGIRTFEASASSVSYADGGSTFLLAYRCPGPEPGVDGCETAFDERFMLNVLRAELPLFKKGGTRLESLRITPLEGAPGADELCYELTARDPASGREQTRRFAARVLAPEQARSDYAVAHALARGPFRGAQSLRVAEPMAAFKGQPRVVLYALEPDGDLRGHLDALSSHAERLAALQRVGVGLRVLHGCGFPTVRSESLAHVISRCLRWLGDRTPGLGAQWDFRADSRAREIEVLLEARQERSHDAMRVPIHGRFGFHCLVRQGQELFLHRFEHVREGHPGLDVGAFLLDLAVYAGPHGADFHSEARAAFLAGYGAERWQGDLPLFLLLSALTRLEERGSGEASNAETERWLELAGPSSDTWDAAGSGAGQ